MTHRLAGYFLESIKKLFKDHFLETKIDGLLKSLTSFDLFPDFKISEHNSNSNPLFLILANYISRGLPTKASCYIESVFQQLFPEIIDYNDEDPVLINEKVEFLDSVFRALHIIEPRLNKHDLTTDYDKSWDKFGQEFDDQFYYLISPEYLGKIFLQIIERDRTLFSILEFSDNKKVGWAKYSNSKYYNIVNQSLTFTIECPYICKDYNGFVIEIDDKTHDGAEQKKIDKTISEILDIAGWNSPFRIKEIEFIDIKSRLKPIQKFIEDGYFDILTSNYDNPLYKTQKGLDALELVLAPMAIARIQRTILEYLIAGKLNLDAIEWKIGVIERDIPCGLIAIEDFKQLLFNILVLKGDTPKIPDIKLYVFYSDEFEKSRSSEINKNNISIDYKRMPINKFSEFLMFNLLIDISLLQRSSIKLPELKTNSLHTCYIRSSLSVQSYPQYYTGELIKYKSILVKGDKNFFNSNDSESTSFEYFSTNLFGFKLFSKPQLELLDNTLQLKNTLGILPPNYKRSLYYQVSGLLQAGITLVITPNYACALNQMEELKRNHISCFFYLKNKYRSQDELMKEFKQLIDSQTLFVFTTSDIFVNPYFRNSLLTLQQNEVYFSYLVIDEIQCISEWSHDFRFSYYNIVKNSTKFLKSKNIDEIPKIGLSETVSFDIIYEIQNELKISEFETIEIPIKLKNFEFNVVDVKCNNVFYNTPSLIAKNAVASKKQVNVSYLVSEFYSDKIEKSGNRQTVIFCPKKDGIFGITDKNNDGLADKLYKNYPNLKIGTFLGSQEDRENKVNLVVSEQSIESQKLLNKSQLDLFLTVDYYNLGTYQNSIRSIIYFNMPGSVEQFVHQTIRACHNGHLASCYLLYNNQPFRLEEESLLNLTGKSGFSEKENEVTVDKLIVKEHFKHSYSNRKKELDVINELLSEITYPVERPLDYVTKIIEDEFNEKVDLVFQPINSPYQLIFYQKGQSLGCIDYRGFTSLVDDYCQDKNKAKVIIDFAKDLIDAKCPKNQNVFKWLKRDNVKDPIKGIEIQINELNSLESRSLVIHFTNDKIRQITDYLNKNISDEFNNKLIYEIYKNSQGVTEFLSKLDEISNIELVTIEKNIPEEIKNYFSGIRDEKDTIKAIHRFSVLGIIDDYTIDYESQIIEIIFSKKEDKFYVKKLYNYLSLFISHDSVLRIFNDINKYPGNSIIQKCLSVLICFVYKEIRPKRLKGILQMEAICKYALKENISEDIKIEELNYTLGNFFYAKYANSILNPNLIDDTENFSKSDFNIVLKYINEVRDVVDNWKHLKNSTSHFLEKWPEDYVLLLLNSFCSFLLENNDSNLFQLAFDRMALGFVKMAEEEKLNFQEYMDRIRTFLNKIYEQNSTLKQTIDPFLYLKAHNTWLSNFNKKFLVNFKTAL